MSYLHNISIKHKLVLMQVFTALLVLTLCIIAITLIDIKGYKQRKVMESIAISKLAGYNSISAIEFMDNEAAEKILSGLRVQHDIINATIIDNKRNVFASYSKLPPDANYRFRIPEFGQDKFVFTKENLFIYSKIRKDKQTIGIVCLRYDLSQLAKIKTNVFRLGLGALVIGTLLAFIISLFVKKYISRPVLRLVTAIQKVRDTADYKIRMSVKGKDEISILSSGINKMLSTIEKSEIELKNQNQEYEFLNENYKIQNENLTKAVHKSEESDRLKSAFLANMSHEIRTPMNGILGFTALLKDNNLSADERNNYIQTIEISGTRLLNIINDIIDISKIEAGLMQVTLSNTNINWQIEYLKDFFHLETQDKGLNLICKYGLAPEESFILTDREKLYAILTNLVKNAIKFTDNGSIELGYEKKGEFLEFYVKDSGIGIPKDRQTAIFERFIQADYTNKMARQGSGLGLAIAKVFVEMLGGKIWVESEIEKGSVFYFTIPYQQEQVKNGTQEHLIAAIDATEPTKNLKILVAEDDAISRTLILKLLKPFGNEILVAKTGLEAVDLYKNNPDIDLILMDMQMPLMDGYEATGIIKGINKKVIIVAQTAFALEGDLEKTKAAGCNDYISKPIKKEVLSKVIQRYFPIF